MKQGSIRLPFMVFENSIFSLIFIECRVIFTDIVKKPQQGAFYY